MDALSRPGKVLYVVPSLPLLTCTFIYREIFDLRDLGFEIETVSMNTPPEDKISSEARSLLATTTYLDQVPEHRKFLAFASMFVTQPGKVLACLREYLSASPMKSFRDYRRLGYHLVEACYLARLMGEDPPDHIHSHFITGATSIAMFLSKLIDVPFSFTMHASALWIDPIALSNKLEACRFCVSISEYNRNYVCETYGEQWRDKINIVHCGILLDAIDTVTGNERDDPDKVTVLAVGQLMKRKGYVYLIEAARILRDRERNIEWIIVGDGYQRPALERMIKDYSLEDVVSMEGARPHEEIPGYLARADIFSLPCIIGDDNTRDGIPVALMEAMALQVPVVSTNIVGLPELIESGADGVLVAPENAEQLADAIDELALSEETRLRLGAAAAQKIEREFNSKRSANQLAALFRSSTQRVEQ